MYAWMKMSAQVNATLLNFPSYALNLLKYLCAMSYASLQYETLLQKVCQIV